MADSLADAAIISQNINRMLADGAGAAANYAQENTRNNSGWAALGLSAARTFETTTQLLTYNGAAFLFGNALQLNAAILESRGVRDQPQTTGAAINPGVVQGQGTPVFVVNPTAGTVQKAG